MMAERLTVLLAGRAVGELARRTGRKLSLHYDDAWRSATDAFPVSLSLPLAAAEHGHRAVSAYLWGLLPENPLVLDRWARQFQVSASDPFALLSAVGEDCPGAVQFARPERLSKLLSPRKFEVEWLTEAEVAGRIQLLRTDHAAWRSPSDTGQFSLAGAQPKTALYFDGRRFGVPAGRIPTTHILKPPLPELDGHTENEHLCLGLAHALGLPAASSHVQRFADELAIVVERYDRVQAGVHWLRVHQEDMCQALSVLPSSKYQSEGGPSAKQVVELLRTYSSKPHEDIRTFVDALIFNWLIAGTDAHAKNYSVLIGTGGRVRLAPLYDVASAYAYSRFAPQKLKLAMKIGRSYKVREIDREAWRAFARDAHLDETELITRALGMAEALPGRFAELRDRGAKEGLRHPAIDRMRDVLAQECARCMTRLT
jgi:serine/threonine-protein kinase HipA